MAQYLYHVSATHNRESILRRGLLPRRPHGPRSNHKYLQRTQPAAVYLSRDPRPYAWAPGRYADVWRVRVDGLTLGEDPLVDYAATYAHRIRPERLELVGEGFDIYAQSWSGEGQREEARQHAYCARELRRARETGTLCDE